MNDHRAASVDDVVRELRREASGPAGGSAGSTSHDGRHRRGPRRSRRRAVLVGCVLAATVVSAVLWQRFSAPAPRAVAAHESTWTDVVLRLDQGRVAAWESGSESALRAVDVPGSEAERADVSRLRSLAAEGVRPRGVRLEVSHVGVVSTSATRVVLRVVDRRPAYELVDLSGAVLRRVPERGAAAWEVELHRAGPSWRLAGARPISRL